MHASLLASWMASTLLATLLGTAASAASQPPAAGLPKIAPTELDLRRGWFKPVTSKDADTLCNALTLDARRYFLSRGDWSQYVATDLAAGTGLNRIPADEAARAAIGLHGLPEEPAQWVLERPNHASLFLYFSTRTDIGATYGAQRLIVSDQHINGIDATLAGSSATPTAEAWTLYRTNSDTWYAAGLVNQHLQLYALTTPSQWHLSCDVALAPYRLRSTLDTDVRTALAAIDALHSSVLALTTSAEHCRRTASLQGTLEQVLYRPWPWLQQRSDIEYQELWNRLTVWSSTGPAAAMALDRYAAELNNSVMAVQYLYTQKFGWSSPAATRIAYDVLTSVVGKELAQAIPPHSHCGQQTAH